MAHFLEIDYRGTHRLIPAKYLTESVLETLPLPSNVLSNLSELDAATNERKIGEQGRNAAISPLELVYEIPESHIVNAAFTHAAPYGGRFNDAHRGAWYAGVELETAVREVSFHKRMFLRDSRFKGRRTFEYSDFLADFAGKFHSLEHGEAAECLQPSPVPQCYAAPQALAKSLLAAKSSGVVYRSVRHIGGTCISCFRPALVHNPRRGNAIKISISAESEEIETTEMARPGGR